MKNELWGVYETDPKKFHGKKQLILKFIENGIDDKWDERIAASKKYGNDSSSLDRYVEIYGEKVGTELFLEKTSKCIVTTDIMLKRYGEEKTQQWKRERTVNKLDVLEERHGKEDAILLKEKYLRNWKESIKKRKELGWNNGLKLEDQIKKHGEIEGLGRWNKKSQKQKNRFSKKWYIEKYGENGGEVKWEEYKTRMKVLSEKAIKTNHKSYSNASQKLFKEILYSLTLDGSQVFYHDNNGEKIIKRYEKSKYIGYYSLDFVFGNKNIEYDGEYWHRNKKEYDGNRDLFLMGKGYKILRVSDKEYKKNPTGILEECKKFLTEEEC
jgi:hypothetical protein